MAYDYKKAISEIESYHRSQKNLIVREFYFTYFSNNDKRYHYKKEYGVSKHEILDKAYEFAKANIKKVSAICNIYCTDIYELHVDNIYSEIYRTANQVKYYVRTLNKEMKDHGKQIQEISEVDWRQ